MIEIPAGSFLMGQPDEMGKPVGCKNLIQGKFQEEILCSHTYYGETFRNRVRGQVACVSLSLGGYERCLAQMQRLSGDRGSGDGDER